MGVRIFKLEHCSNSLCNICLSEYKYFLALED
jgi:hypothetical protein